MFLNSITDVIHPSNSRILRSATRSHVTCASFMAAGAVNYVRDAHDIIREFSKQNVINSIQYNKQKVNKSIRHNAPNHASNSLTVSLYKIMQTINKRSK